MPKFSEIPLHISPRWILKLKKKQFMIGPYVLLSENLEQMGKNPLNL